METNIFLGSTKRGLKTIKQFFNDFEKNYSDCKIIKWKSSKVFPWGNNTIDDLIKQLDNCQFAIFFIVEEDIIKVKNKFVFSQNVLFEIGLFAGRYTIKNIIIMIPDVANIEKLFSKDLSGINTLNYEKTRLKEFEYCTKLFSEIHNHMNNRINEINNDKELEIFTNRHDCYVKGIKIVNNANSDIFSILSYSDELNNGRFQNSSLQNPDSDEYKLREAFEKRALEPGIQVNRYMNLGNQKIEEQAKDLIEKTGGIINIYDTYCKFIEVIVAGDEVLIVLPNFKTNPKKVKVNFGIYIKNVKVARDFIEWCRHLVPATTEIKSLDGLNDYMEKEIRNVGSRKIKCLACDEQ